MEGKVVTPPARGGPNGAPTPDAERAAMLAYARAVLEQFLLSDTLPMSRVLPAHLAERRQGVFVTLRQRGQLRGCIGRVEPDGPLPWVLGGVTLQSALRDPRFQPVTPGQLREIDIEISLLTPLRRVSSPFLIVAGRDGVVLSKAGRSSVFLPHVAVDEGWTRDEMLDHLAVKAGLPADSWRVGADLFVFQAEVFNERSGQKK
jgi:AmmeMemoRadiSam system protein A